MDNIGWTLQFGEMIRDFEKKEQEGAPWLFSQV